METVTKEIKLTRAPVTTKVFYWTTELKTC